MPHATAIPRSPIDFYDTGMSPFAQRVWIVLLEKQLNFNQQIVDLKSKSKHFTNLFASIHPDPTASAKVPIIVELFVAGWYKMLGADSSQALNQAKDNFDNGLKTLNTYIEQNSFEGSFLLGTEYSYAEVAAATFVYHASLTLPYYRGYSLEAALQQHNLTCLQDWFKAASERPAFQQTLPQADKMIAAWVVCLGEFKGHVKQ